MRYFIAFLLLVVEVYAAHSQEATTPIPAPSIVPTAISQPFTMDEINAIVNVQMAQKAFLEAQEAYQKASAIQAAQSAYAKIKLMNSPVAEPNKNDKTK